VGNKKNRKADVEKQYLMNSLPWVSRTFGGGGWWPKVRIYVILGGGFKYFLFSPQPGEMIHFD